MRKISKEDIEFLKELQHELNTQETDFEAAPRYWVVAQNERRYGVSVDVSDGSSLCDRRADAYIGDTIDEIIENLDDVADNFLEMISFLDDLKDVANFLNRQYGEDRYEVYYYSIDHNIRKNGSIFLTKKECKDHINLNKHHYNDTVHTYADTAWRSPTFERVLEILENCDFEEIEVK